MAFLADDQRQGRATGSPGFDAAARYVAEQFTDLDLQPPQDTFRQEFSIQQRQVIEDRTSLTIASGQTREELAYGRDFVSYGKTAANDIALNDEIVFVGDGVTVARRGIDAYKDVRAAGRIVMAFAGASAGLRGPEAGFFADTETKAANAADHGADALLLVEEEHIPWDLRVRAARQLGSSEWLPPHADRGLKANAYISPPAELRTANIWGLIKGADPVLASEYVVIAAHLDHLGMDASLLGDAIYNGAVDNASGVAGLLTIAKAFVELTRKPARSVLFLATAGEELGEIGSAKAATTRPF